MSNPLSLFPIALAAGGGRVDDLPATGAVAAGFTLLQRSAPLVRAMAGVRSAVLLPPSAAVMTALAASDGRGCVFLPPSADEQTMASMLADADVGAVFTTHALAAHLPVGRHAVVLLDDAPHAATVIARGTETVVDLGSHFGLDLEGEEEAGRDEECVISYGDSPASPAIGAVFTHRNLLALARGAVDAVSLLKGDVVLAALPPANFAGFALTIAGPLLAGAHVITLPRFDAQAALQAIEGHGVTILVGESAMFAAMAAALETRGHGLAAPTLRVCVCLGAEVDIALQDEWHRRTGIELRFAFGTPDAPFACFNAPHFPNRRGTLGVPFPGMQVSVRNTQNGEPVPSGKAGELWLRGDPMCSWHLNAPATAARRADGWLPTAVQVRERPDGAFERAT
ncbi:MAG TPA: AMP-binding protein [Gemmatimonadaceae bacterium]